MVRPRGEVAERVSRRDVCGEKVDLEFREAVRTSKSARSAPPGGNSWKRATRKQSLCRTGETIAGTSSEPATRVLRQR